MNTSVKLKFLLIVFVLNTITYDLVAQNNPGIFFQAVARDNYFNPAKNRKIYVLSSIIQSSVTGNKVLVEEHQTNTDASGMFSIIIGNGTRTGDNTTGLSGIDWSNGPFYLNLKVAITPVSGDNGWDYTKEWMDMGTTSFGAVPYALYAANAAGVNQKLNISDTAIMLKPFMKKLDTATLSNRIDLKASASDLTSGLALKLNKADTSNLSNRIDLKASVNNPIFTGTVAGIDKKMVGLGNVDNTSDILKPISSAAQTALDLKANTTDVNSALNLKANSSDITTTISSKVDKVPGKDLSTNDYTNIEKAKLASITGTNTGDQDLSSLATNTALALKANLTDVNTALNSKANTTDVSTALNLKANSTDVNSALNLKANSSDITTTISSKVDKVTGKDLSTNDYTNIEKAKLASITGTNTGDQDLSGLATNTALALKANITDVNTALNSKANTTDVSTALNLKANSTDVNSALNLKANSSDITTTLSSKVDKVTGKDLSTNDYTNIEKAKLASITGTNTGDQDLSGLATNTALALKANITDVNTALNSKANTTDVSTALNLKANSTDVNSALNLKANSSDVTTTLSSKVDKVAGKDLSTNDYTNAEKAKLAAITGTNTGDQDLSGLATNTALTLKANITDVNTALNLKANSTDVNSALNLKANITDVNNNLVLKANLASPTFTGTVGGIDKTMVGLGNADNTSDANKPLSTATQTALDLKANSLDVTTNLTLKAPLVSPNLSGIPTAPTATPGTNNMQIANTSFVTDAINTANATNANLTGDVTSIGNSTTIGAGKITNEMLAGSIDLTSKVTGILPAANGGTGVANTGKTITLGGNLTTYGTYSTTITTTNTTNVTLPTTGTLATLAGTEILTNKTLTSPNLTSPALGTPTSINLSNAQGLPLATSGAVTGILPYQNGGTGKSTLREAFNSLSPMGRQGDMIYYDGTNAVKLSSTTTGSFLTLVSSTSYPFNPIPTWASPTDVFNTIKDVVTALPNVKLVSGALSNISNLSTLTSLPNLDFSNITSKLSATTLANITAVGNLVAGSIPYSLLTGNVPIWNQSTTGGAASLTTARNIYGYSFDGTSNLTGVIASQYGGTGNGFTKFIGPTSSEKTFTLPNTSATILTSNAAVTVAQGGTGLTTAGTDGQILTSTGSGTLTWTTPPGAGTHTIGESYGGGIVFYVFDNGKHGLIAATSDQSTGMRWHGGANTITRARADGVGAGLKNTAIIIANQGALDGNEFAATVCNEYSVTETVGGITTTYGDWYLPSKHELDLLYLQKTVVGGFSSDYYWSSSESDNNLGPDHAWVQYFSDGNHLEKLKDNLGYVRAIRTF